MNPLFPTVCFLVLMQNDQGIIDKHPSYITEKTWLLNASNQVAFQALDIYNMRKVKEWHDTWGVPMPPECASYLAASEEAYSELQGRGFEL